MPRHSPIITAAGRPLATGAIQNAVSRTDAPVRRPLRAFRLVVSLALLTLLLLGIQNAYPALTGSDLFLLEEISVTGQQMLSTRALVEASGLQPGLNLFEADLETAQKVVSAIPVVAEVLIIRQPPGGLVISVQEREPVVLVSTRTQLMGMSGDGTLFELPAATLDLPLVTGLERAEKDSLSAVALKQVASFAAALRKGAPSFLARVSEIHVASPRRPDDLQVLLMESVLRIRMQSEDPLSQVRNLEAYVRSGAIERDRPAYVDLRFRDQVVAGLQ